MKRIKPEGLKEIKGGGDGAGCVCSTGNANAQMDGFLHCTCGSQCSYGATNSSANQDKAYAKGTYNSSE